MKCCHELLGTCKLCHHLLNIGFEFSEDEFEPEDGDENLSERRISLAANKFSLVHSKIHELKNKMTESNPVPSKVTMKKFTIVNMKKSRLQTIIESLLRDFYQSSLSVHANPKDMEPFLLTFDIHFEEYNAHFIEEEGLLSTDLPMFILENLLKQIQLAHYFEESLLASTNYRYTIAKRF